MTVPARQIASADISGAIQNTLVFNTPTASFSINGIDQLDYSVTRPGIWTIPTDAGLMASSDPTYVIGSSAAWGTPGIGSIQNPDINATNLVAVGYKTTVPSNGPSIGIFRTRAATSAPTTAVVAGDSIGGMYSAAADGTNYQPNCGIDFSVTPGFSIVPGHPISGIIKFYTAKPDNTYLPRFAMLQDGTFLLDGSNGAIAYTSSGILEQNAVVWTGPDTVGSIYIAGAAGNTDTTKSGGLQIYNCDPEGDAGTISWQLTPNVLSMGTMVPHAGHNAKPLQFISGGTNVLDYGLSYGDEWSIPANGTLTFGQHDSERVSIGQDGPTLGTGAGQLYISSNLGTVPASLRIYNAIGNFSGDYGHAIIDWQRTGDVLTIGTISGLGNHVYPIQFVAGSSSSAPPILDYGVTHAGMWTFPAATFVMTSSTVSTLPAAGTMGRRAFVSDANATTFATVVAAGGANKVPVYDDGTNWRIG